MKISSESFPDRGVIDSKYAMKAVSGGMNLSPHVLIEDIPATTQSIAIVFVDRHSMARNWIHWMAINLPPSAAVIAEGASGSGMPGGTVELENTFGFRGYGGPQPPRGSGIHTYELTAYCLSGEIKPVSARPSEKEFIGMAQGMIIARARISAGFENR